MTVLHIVMIEHFHQQPLFGGMREWNCSPFRTPSDRRKTSGMPRYGDKWSRHQASQVPNHQNEVEGNVSMNL